MTVAVVGPIMLGRLLRAAAVLRVSELQDLLQPLLGRLRRRRPPRVRQAPQGQGRTHGRGWFRLGRGK